MLSNTTYEAADFALFGAPFDSTASYRPGARFGCRAIRSEFYGIETYSTYQDRDLSETAVFDCGDLELCAGDSEIALRQIEAHTAGLLRDGKRPVMLGGEHLVTLGAIRAVHEKYPDLCVIHFDAHADLRDEYLGARLSHATVMRRVYDLLGKGRICQFGIRSGDKSEFDWLKTQDIHSERFGAVTLPEAIRRIGGAPVWFTLDLDVLDPSELPGTGTPEAGGWIFGGLMSAVSSMTKLNIAGFDMVELAPNCDPSGRSTALACKLLRELLLYFTLDSQKKM
jgi:agmatinase